MYEVHHINIVIYERSKETEPRDQRSSDSSSLWQRLHNSVDLPGMLDPVVVHEEVKAQDYAVLGLDLWAI